MVKKNVVLVISGSVAATRYKDICIELLNRYNLTVIYTKAAEFFINQYELSQLVGYDNVIGSQFTMKEAGLVQHVNLAKETDLTIIAPATYNMINKITCGICDDFGSSYLSVIDKDKLLICPAMNNNMYKQDVLHKSIIQLKEYGTIFTGPIIGPLANGEEQIGHMQSLGVIISMVEEILKEENKV